MSTLSQHEIKEKLNEFKQFINSKPELIESIRKNDDILQTYFEKWIVLGPNDSYWKEKNSGVTNKTYDSMDETADTPGYSDFVRQLTSYLEKFNIEKIEDHMGSLNETIRLVQDFIGNFKTPTNSVSEKENERPIHHLRD